MSFEALLLHTVDVYRGGSGSWASTGRTGQKAGVQPKSEAAKGMPGEGGQYAGTHLVFMLADADVQEGDIIEVASGSGTFGHLFVEAVHVPRGHHAEVVATEVLEDPTA